MTLADKLRQERIHKGREEDVQEVQAKLIKNLLVAGMSVGHNSNK